MFIWIIEEIYHDYECTSSNCVAAFTDKEKAEDIVLKLNLCVSEARYNKLRKWETPIGNFEINGFLYPYYQLEEVQLIK